MFRWSNPPAARTRVEVKIARAVPAGIGFAQLQLRDGSGRRHRGSRRRRVLSRWARGRLDGETPTVGVGELLAVDSMPVRPGLTRAPAITRVATSTAAIAAPRRPTARPTPSPAPNRAAAGVDRGEHWYRLGDALQPATAAWDVSKVAARPRQPAHGIADQHLPGRSDGAESRGHVDRRSNEATLRIGRLPGVNADGHLDRQVGVVLGGHGGSVHDRDAATDGLGGR